jgi:hypothetical protein
MYVMCFVGFAPIGNFMAGALAEAIGANRALAVCGTIAALAGSAFALGFRSWAGAVRPIYIKRGIIQAPQR